MQKNNEYSFELTVPKILLIWDVWDKPKAFYKSLEFPCSGENQTVQIFE